MSSLHTFILTTLRRSAPTEERSLLTFSKSACVSLRHHLSCLEVIAQQSNQSRKKLKRKQNLKQYKKLENAGKTRETVWSSACHPCWISDQPIKQRSHWMLRSIKSFANAWFWFCLAWILSTGFASVWAGFDAGSRSRRTACSWLCWMACSGFW